MNFSFITHTEHLKSKSSHIVAVAFIFFYFEFMLHIFRLILKHCFEEDHLYSLIGLPCSPTVWSWSPSWRGGWIPFIWLIYLVSFSITYAFCPKYSGFLLMFIYSLIWINYSLLWGQALCFKYQRQGLCSQASKYVKH